MRSLTKAGICALVFVACLTVLACIGKDEATQQQEQYCNNVGSGLWPDYQKTYKAECGGKDPPKYSEEIAK